MLRLVFPLNRCDISSFLLLVEEDFSGLIPSEAAEASAIKVEGIFLAAMDSIYEAEYKNNRNEKTEQGASSDGDKLPV